MPMKPKYTYETLQEAVVELKRERTSIRSVAIKWGIPRTSLERYMKNPPIKRSFGPQPVLNSEEEEELVKWLADMARKGFPRKTEDICITAKSFLDRNPRPNPFKDNLPGYGWVKGFLKRHPQLVQRTSEGIISDSSCLSESNIRKWFKDIKEYFEENNLISVLNDPKRIFSADETGFSLCSCTGKVATAKGIQNVGSMEKGSEKEYMTILFNFSADGKCCPPMVVHPCKKLPQKITSSVPCNWTFRRSNNGWMTADLFYDYIKNTFSPMLDEENIERPVILYVDGHKSHLTLQLSELCSQLEIQLIALYPNMSSILQPANVAVFRPIKQTWKKEARKWEEQHPNLMLNKLTLPSVLKKALETGCTSKILKNGFKETGLYPFNPDVINFSKCLGKKNTPDRDEITQRKKPVLTYEEFVNMVGESKLKEMTEKPSPTALENIILKIHDFFEDKQNSISTGRRNELSCDLLDNPNNTETLTTQKKNKNPLTTSSMRYFLDLMEGSVNPSSAGSLATLQRNVDILNTLTQSNFLNIKSESQNSFESIDIPSIDTDLMEISENPSSIESQAIVGKIEPIEASSSESKPVNNIVSDLTTPAIPVRKRKRSAAIEFFKEKVKHFRKRK